MKGSNIQIKLAKVKRAKLVKLEGTLKNELNEIELVKVKTRSSPSTNCPHPFTT